MAVKTAQITVGATPTALSGSETDKPLADGMSIAVKNASQFTLYVGGPDVTTTSGWPLGAGEKESYDLGPRDALYGVVASGTITVATLRVGA
jgi:hypothetical protein